MDPCWIIGSKLDPFRIQAVFYHLTPVQLHNRPSKRRVDVLLAKPLVYTLFKASVQLEFEPHYDSSMKPWFTFILWWTKLMPLSHHTASRWRSLKGELTWISKFSLFKLSSCQKTNFVIVSPYFTNLVEPNAFTKHIYICQNQWMWPWQFTFNEWGLSWLVKECFAA